MVGDGFIKLFISVEASNSAAFIINDIRKIIENKMGKIEVCDYTNNIESIGIIINSWNQSDLNFGHGKERKYINYKQRFADIRLNIPYDEFLSADKQKRFEMVKKNIYDSIRVVDERINKKKGCSFDGERLIADIETKLKNLEL